MHTANILNTVKEPRLAQCPSSKGLEKLNLILVLNYFLNGITVNNQKNGKENLSKTLRASLIPYVSKSNYLRINIRIFRAVLCFSKLSLYLIKGCTVSDAFIQNIKGDATDCTCR